MFIEEGNLLTFLWFKCTAPSLIIVCPTTNRFKSYFFASLSIFNNLKNGSLSSFGASSSGSFGTKVMVADNKYRVICSPLRVVVCLIKSFLAVASKSISVSSIKN